MFLLFQMAIDINQVDEDIVTEHIAPENEDARAMLDRLSQKIMWKSPQEVYLEGILKEIKHIEEIPESDKTSNDREKYLKFLKEIDNICGFSKDKRDIKIETKLRSAADIFNATQI